MCVCQRFAVAGFVFMCLCQRTMDRVASHRVCTRQHMVISLQVQSHQHSHTHKGITERRQTIHKLRLCSTSLAAYIKAINLKSADRSHTKHIPAKPKRALCTFSHW